MSIFHFDGGNRLIKSCTHDNEGDAWVHAIQEISKLEYDNELSRGTYRDLYIINGKFYRVGYRAESYSNVLKGASRYQNKQYYQTMLGVSLYNTYTSSEKRLTLFAGHAPQDINYRESIRASAMANPIVVENNGTSRTYKFTRAEFWDEPIGGIMNQILTMTGKQAKGVDYASGASVVFDIGGHTIDSAVVENNRVRTDELDSFTQTNLLQAENALWYELRNRMPEQMANVEKRIVNEKIRDALMTGKLDAGGYGKIDIQDVVEDILYDMVNFIAQVYQERGGTFRFHHVILTGGGSVLLERYIRKSLTALGRDNGEGIHLAGTRYNAHFANVFGSAKLSSFYVRHGKL